MSAPVQVLVVALESPTYDGTVLAELARLREAGLVRLIDLVVLRRDADGSFDTVPLPDGAPEGLGRIAEAFLTDDAGAGPDPRGADVLSVTDVVPVGGLAVVALLEHLWAAPLVGVIASAGGTPLDESWLTQEDRARLAELERANG